MTRGGKPKNLGDVVVDVIVPEPPEGWDERERKLLAQRQAREAELEIQELHERRRRLVQWGVPVKDVERITHPKSFALKKTKALAAAYRFNQAGGGGGGEGDDGRCILVLAGSIGCGKTTAAAWWLSQPGPPSKYLTLKDPLFVPTFRLERQGRYTEEGMARLERARRLVIDDLGTEYADARGNFLVRLRALVDSRYNDRLPMLITTNLTGAEFSERYGDRTVSRLNEVGRYLEVQDKDLRRE